MSEIDNTQALLKWYEDHTRSFLLNHLAEERVQDFDKDHARLKRLCYADGMTAYLTKRRIRIFDFTQFAKPLTW